MKSLVKKIVDKSSAPFIWRLSMLSQQERKALCTLYAFYQHLDNIVQSSESDAEKIELVKAWRREIDNIYERKSPVSKIGRSIYKNCKRFHLPKSDLINFLDGITTDISQPMQAPSIKKLQKYFGKIASAPSSIFLRILGCKDEKLIKDLSKNLGQAVQITNILRDIREDAAAGRLYIPEDLLQEAGIETTDPKAVITDKNLNIARQAFAAWAEESYKKTFSLMEKLDKKTARSIKAVVYIYKKYFDMMNQRGWEIISPKPEIGTFSRLYLILKAFSGK